MTQDAREPSRAVPAFREFEFQPKGHDFCICVFVIDEGEKFHKQLRSMESFLDHVDLVIADGGSTDGSVEPDRLKPLKVNTLLVKTGPGKLGAQMRMAFRWAMERGYRGLITMDGNNKDGPEAIPRFIDALKEGMDHVQGSRFIPGGKSENLPLERWLGLKLIHGPMIRLASGYPYTDTTNGFRGYSAKFLSDPKVDLFRDVFRGYELHYYLAVKAARLGYRVSEVPVARRYPGTGSVPSKISPLKGNINVLRALFAVCLGHYDPKGES